MPQTHSSKIILCFPDKAKFKTKKAFINALIQPVKATKKMGYAGYSQRKYLSKVLEERFDNKAVKAYKPLSEDQKTEFIEKINSTLQKCQKVLKIKVSSVSIFVFPWFPKSKDSEFGGVDGFTPYANVFHLFISADSFMPTSLVETIVHELNHALFFRNVSENQTLLQSIVSEGLAENFREEVVGGISAPWSLALTLEESKKLLRDLEPVLDKYGLYKKVFWEGKKYKRWSGYSIGYRLVRAFRDKNPQIPWKKIISMDSGSILRLSQFTKK